MLIQLLIILFFLSSCGENNLEDATSDSILWYNNPAANWFEALPLGNGKLGAMVHGTLEKEKLQGVLEMAGAVCHEINQPLQTIIGYSTLYQEKDSISSRELNYIKAQAARIGDITKRLSNITQYKTINYPGNTKIVDIWGSSSDSS